MNASDEIINVLQELTSQPLKIKYAALIPVADPPLSTSMGLIQNNALAIAKVIPYLTESTGQELQWNGIHKICIQGKGGYVILERCVAEVFLLVHTHRTVMGLLDREISLTVAKLQGIFQNRRNGSLDSLETAAIATVSENNHHPTAHREEAFFTNRTINSSSIQTVKKYPAPDVYPSAGGNNTGLDRDFIARCEQKLAFCIGPIASVIIQQVLSQAEGKTPQQFINDLEQAIPDPNLTTMFRDQFSPE